MFCKCPQVTILLISALQADGFCGKIVRTVKILVLSDKVEERLYSLVSASNLQEVELILGCGDLPYAYLENLLTLLNVPLYYVPGNHDPIYNERDSLAHAEGGFNLDLKLVRENKFLIAGFGGCIRYRPDGTNQYTQLEAYLRALRLLPGLLWNRVHYRRYLDILISHSPPFGIHDEDTRAHQGLKAVNWLLRMSKPRYHFHGHTHFYRRNLAASETTIGLTRIINVYPYRIMEVSH
jgi:Icc-related predicted phosphoesterase